MASAIVSFTLIFLYSRCFREWKTLPTLFRMSCPAESPFPLRISARVWRAMPTMRRAGKTQRCSRSRMWLDFVSCVKSEHPDVVNAGDVTESIASDYIVKLWSSGHFIRTRSTASIPSPRTRNTILAVLKYTFERAGQKCGIMENPFSDVTTQDAFRACPSDCSRSGPLRACV